LPKRNEIDLDDIPKEVRDTMTFVPVEELSEVLQHALGKRVITPVELGDGSRLSNVVPLRQRAGQVQRRAANGAVKRPAERKRTRSRR
jgi:predicted ATP-dependent protease